MKSTWRIGAFTLAAILLAGVAIADWVPGPPAPVLISGSEQQYDLAGRVEILKDPDHLWSVEQVTSGPVSRRFSPAGPKVPHLGLSDAVVWVRFTVKGPLPDGWVLYVGWPYLASVRFRELRQNAGEMVLGRSPGDRTFEAWAFADKQQASWTVYARFVSQGMLTLPMKLYTDTAFLSYQRMRSMAYGLYYGIIAAMALYNLFLFFSLRDRAYLYYVFYTCSLLLYFFALNGLTLEYLFAGRRALDTRFNFFFLSLIFVTAGLFTRRFLATGKNAPWIDRSLFIVIVLGGLLSVLSFFMDFSVLSATFSVMGTISPFVLITAAVVIWRRGFAPARYYLLAWSIYAAGTLVFALTYSGVLEFTSLRLHSYQAASAVEAILLSFALADRIRVLRREREEAMGNERRAMDLAFTDALSGLYSSRFFRAQIGPEMQKAGNMDQPLSLLMLDVDDFKHFNDEYGHIQGDQVLTRLGDAIRAQVRDKDYACRYGGEEFAVIMPGVSPDKAMEAADRIRKAFGGQVFAPRPGKKVQVTVSIGVASYEPGLMPDDFVDQADQALYLAKAAGKNSTMLWRALPH